MIHYRIIARSEKSVLFVGYGIHLEANRALKASFNKRIGDAHKSTFDKPSVQESIERVFGQGSLEHIIKAFSTRGMGTVLINGGGEALPLPAKIRREQIMQDFDAISPSMELDIPDQKCCVECGKKLKVRLDNHSLEFEKLEEYPKTIEECQRLTNERVVGISGFSSNRGRDYWPYVNYYYTWDGESYYDEHFCSTKCTVNYANKAVKILKNIPC